MKANLSILITQINYWNKKFADRCTVISSRQSIDTVDVSNDSQQEISRYRWLVRSVHFKLKRKEAS